jgi:hypothetical protein
MRINIHSAVVIPVLCAVFVMVVNVHLGFFVTRIIAQILERRLWLTYIQYSRKEWITNLVRADTTFARACHRVVLCAMMAVIPFVFLQGLPADKRGGLGLQAKTTIWAGWCNPREVGLKGVRVHSLQCSSLISVSM